MHWIIFVNQFSTCACKYRYCQSSLLKVYLQSSSENPFWKVVRRLSLLSKRHYSSYYKKLGISNDADIDTLKKAYYAKCKELHPDINKNEKAMQKEFLEVQRAYHVLRSTSSRKEYDIYLKSIDQSQHDFHEWKTYKARKTEGKRDYHRYNTAPNTSQGLDAKWSDFTFWDISGLFVCIAIVVYIVRTELYHRNQNLQFNHSRQVHYVPNASQMQKVFLISNTKNCSETAKTSNGLSQPALSKPNNKSDLSGQLEQLMTKGNAKVPKKLDTENIQNEPILTATVDTAESELLDPFESIKKNGKVSQEALERLKNTSNTLSEKRDIVTWKTISH